MNCTICQAPLSGGVDTFGDHDLPMCEHDFLALIGGPRDDGYPLMFTCTRLPDGTLATRMTDEWKALEDAMEAAYGRITTERDNL